MSDYILGGGMAGLIWGVCHPGSTIIEAGKIGGMVNNNLGPMMLHSTPQVEEFMANLGLDVKTKSIRVGYTYGLDKPVAIQPERYQEEYIAHSRKLPQLEVAKNGHKSMMNSGEKTFLAIEAKMANFTEAMVNRIASEGGHIIEAEVSNIEPSSSLLFYDDTKSEYESIVSTLPMYVMKRLVHEGNDQFPEWSEMKDFIMHKVFVKLEYAKDVRVSAKMRGFDFVYSVPKCRHSCSSTTNDFLTRVVLHKTLRTVLEYTVPSDADTFDTFITEMNAKPWCHSPKPLKNTMIRRDIGIKKVCGIKMVGRYAQWTHSIRLHNVIDEAMR